MNLSPWRAAINESPPSVQASKPQSHKASKHATRPRPSYHHNHNKYFFSSCDHFPFHHASGKQASKQASHQAHHCPPPVLFLLSVVVILTQIPSAYYLLVLSSPSQIPHIQNWPSRIVEAIRLTDQSSRWTGACIHTPPTSRHLALSPSWCCTWPPFFFAIPLLSIFSVDVAASVLTRLSNRTTSNPNTVRIVIPDPPFHRLCEYQYLCHLSHLPSPIFLSLHNTSPGRIRMRLGLANPLASCCSSCPGLLRLPLFTCSPAPLPHYCPLPVADPVRGTITFQYCIGNPAPSSFQNTASSSSRTLPVPSCKGTYHPHLLQQFTLVHCPSSI